MNMTRFSKTDAYQRRSFSAAIPFTVAAKFLWCFWNSW